MGDRTAANRLFVYGTLKSGFANPYARSLRAGAAMVARTHVAGALFDMGNYPGFRREFSGTVFGELYELRDPVSLFALLDAYEGEEYRRIAVETAGHGLAWIYELADLPVTPRIQSGDYSA